MVSLRSLVTGAVALMAATVTAAATPQQIADGLKSITQKFAALQEPAQSITILNAPLIIIGQGPFPVIIAGLADIASTGDVLASQLGGTGPINKRERRVAAGMARRGADADLIFNTFRELVRVTQATLNILIGKAGILTKVPLVGPPVAAALRRVEAVIDTIAITLINLVQARAGDLESQADALGNTLDLAIKQYEGLSI